MWKFDESKGYVGVYSVPLNPSFLCIYQVPTGYGVGLALWILPRLSRFQKPTEGALSRIIELRIDFKYPLLL